MRSVYFASKTTIDNISPSIITAIRTAIPSVNTPKHTRRASSDKSPDRVLVRGASLATWMYSTSSSNTIITTQFSNFFLVTIYKRNQRRQATRTAHEATQPNDQHRSTRKYLHHRLAKNKSALLKRAALIPIVGTHTTGARIFRNATRPPYSDGAGHSQAY